MNKDIFNPHETEIMLQNVESNVEQKKKMNSPIFGMGLAFVYLYPPIF